MGVMRGQFLIYVVFVSNCSSLLLQGITSTPTTRTSLLTDKHYNFLLDLLADEKLLRHQLERSVIKEQEDIRNITELLKNIQSAPPACRKLVNVALGKNAMMISELAPNQKAEKAVDGKLETYAHTNQEHLPWLLIDLGTTYDIKKITIFNRVDCCGERLHSLHVSIGETTSNLSLCGHFAGPGANGQEITLRCPISLKGRYVKLMINDSTATYFLNVAEVAVYA